MSNIKSRFAPLAVLIDARLLPIILLGAVQSYTVYRALLIDDNSTSGWWVAVLGAASIESTYLGLAMWADRQHSGRWIFATELVAVVYAIAFAICVHNSASIVAYYLRPLLFTCFPVLMIMYVESTRKLVRRDDPPVLAKQIVDVVIQGETPSTSIVNEASTKRIPPRRLSTKRKIIDEATVNEMRNKRNQGMTFEEIAREYKLTRQAVQRRLKVG